MDKDKKNKKPINNTPLLLAEIHNLIKGDKVLLEQFNKAMEEKSKDWCK